MTHETQNLPILPLKNTVLFPGMFVPLSAGRASSKAAVDAVLATEDRRFLAVTQLDEETEQPGENDLHKVGTVAVILKAVKSDESVEILVQGVERVKVETIVQTEPYLIGEYVAAPLPEDEGTEVEALHRAVMDTAREILELVEPESPEAVEKLISDAENPLHLAYLLASMMNMPTDKEQAILEADSKAEALRLLHEALAHELQVLTLRDKISRSAQSEMTKQQREYFLRSQMEAIQEELGESNSEEGEVNELRARLSETDMPDEIRKEAERELKRLGKIPSVSPEFQVARSHLELILDLPWSKRTLDNLDLVGARKVLDKDHFDLSEVKDRIVENLAVLKLNPDSKAPILCLVGPPGVGKTSLGESVARALGRKFERLSLGGLHDESELRGHRRTYIGAMPGRIIQAIRRAGVNNPVLMLDEIDKLGQGFRGDPASALLEVLDPAQNNTFRDNYLDLPFDLSKVLFLTTANSLETIPRPLLDRMEVLRLSGYSTEEKLQIAKTYLVPRQRTEAGLDEGQVVVTDDAVRTIVERYTREAGVRELERALGRVHRKVARNVGEGSTENVTVGSADVEKFLGREKVRPDRFREKMSPGVATGLAWTETGGDVLYIETALLEGGKGTKLTGQLGGVMRESAQAARSFLWSNARKYGLVPQRFRESGLHIHVPSGSIPKDGPSAGVTIVTALASLLKGVPIREGLAMTGEVTLAGLVLPVGGIKEKVLAARRAGVKTVILPKDNEPDLADLPEDVRESMKFIPVDTVDGVFRHAFAESSESMRKWAKSLRN